MPVGIECTSFKVWSLVPSDWFF